MLASRVVWWGIFGLKITNLKSQQPLKTSQVHSFTTQTKHRSLAPMETTVSTTTLFTISRALNSPLTKSLLHKNLQKRFSTSIIRCISNPHFHKFISTTTSPPPTSLLPTHLHPTSPFPPRSACLSASFASSGGTGNGFVGGNGSGGDGGGHGGGGGGDGEGGIKSKAVEEVNALSPDVIILDVGGMTCGGCAASVKRILENQPQVSSASVNLATETAIIWPITEAKSMNNWQQQLGEALAKHLTSCGFKSNLRGLEAVEGNVIHNDTQSF